MGCRYDPVEAEEAYLVQARKGMQGMQEIIAKTLGAEETVARQAQQVLWN
jgi:hypothetical protein